MKLAHFTAYKIQNSESRNGLVSISGSVGEYIRVNPSLDIVKQIESAGYMYVEDYKLEDGDGSSDIDVKFTSDRVIPDADARQKAVKHIESYYA